MFASAETVVRQAADIIKPKRQISVTDNATEHVVLKSAMVAGPYDPNLSPLMREPADLMTSRVYDSVIFVGPAQIGKTLGLIVNSMVHRIMNDPTDMMIIEKSQGDARTFSKVQFDRLVGDSPEIAKRMKKGRGDDNVFAKTTTSGTVITFAHPSHKILAGKSIPLMLMPDYDRHEDDVGNEGGVFEQASQRPKSFMSKGMSIAESTPSRPVLDPTWRPSKGSHSAPPTNGILGLYNNGDRRMAYAKCPECGDYFTPDPNPETSAFIPKEGTPEERASKVCLICTCCGGLIGAEHQSAIKKSGVWLREGQTISPDGVITGEGLKSKRASFWISGWFATFTTWEVLALTYIRALETFELSGDEKALKNVYNQGFAAPYIEQAKRKKVKGYEEMKERSNQVEQYYVPHGVRTIMVSVDIQGGKDRRFEVMVTGFGKQDRTFPMDRFPIDRSKRPRMDDPEKMQQVDPSTYIEDWDLLAERANSTYRLAGEDGELAVHMMAIDCGGEEGVYETGLKWWRSLSFELKSKIRLVKGAALNVKQSDLKPKVVETAPDSRKRKDKKVTSTGDVPILMINTGRFKDEIVNSLSRKVDGPGYVSFPAYWKDKHYDELMNSEVKDPVRGWEQIRGKKNETLDLFCYAKALWHYIKGHMIDWDRPPPWADVMSKNLNVVSKAGREKLKARPYRRY